MQNIYSFKKNKADFVSENLFKAFPHIKTVYALYYNKNQQLPYFYKQGNKNEPNNNFLVSDASITNIRKNKKIDFSWSTINNIPFNKKEISNKRLNIFDEKNNIVLNLRYDNKFDANQDVFYIEFQEDLNIFGISEKDLMNSTSQKNIIGNIIYSMLKAQIQDYEDNYEVWQAVSRKTQNILNSSKNNKQLIQQEKEAYKNSLERLTLEYLNYFGNKYNAKIICSPTVMERISQYRGNLYVLKDIIKNAILFSLNIYSSTNSNNIILEEEYLDFSLEKENVVNDNSKKDASISTALKQNISREQKIKEYLFKLLKSVELLLNRNEKITGKNVGTNCNPKITAPAITGYITKNRSLIIKIINNSPETYTVLTDNFKPITNLFYNNPIAKKQVI